MRNQELDQFEATNIQMKRVDFKVGDTVKVSTKIIEGEKERIQAYTGVVIAKKGIGASETFTVYRNAYGSSMERVFLLHSPRVANIEVVRVGDVCKSKLYYIRGESGKKAKIKEKFGVLSKKEEELSPEMAEEVSSQPASESHDLPVVESEVKTEEVSKEENSELKKQGPKKKVVKEKKVQKEGE